MRHFEATGCKYPLVVKLGTITPHGADVYSYANNENDMVQDPYLVGPTRTHCTSSAAHMHCFLLQKVFAVQIHAESELVAAASCHLCASESAALASANLLSAGSRLMATLLYAGRAPAALGHQHDVHAEDREDNGRAPDRPERVL